MKTQHHWRESHNERMHFFMSNMPQDNHNHSNGRNSAHNSHKPVSFFCAAPNAKSVELVGDFNHWHPFPMQRSVDGWWRAHVELSHGHHQYRFLVDGQPMLDPHATGIVIDEHDERASLVAVS